MKKNILVLVFLAMVLSCKGESIDTSLPSGGEGPEIPDSEEVIPVNVSETEKQDIYLGIDAERLWYWKNYIKDELADLGVKELQSKFVRVAINCKYEREKGGKDETAYTEDILVMMEAMKKANPNIEFFASPRPLGEAYTKEEKEKIWGHEKNVPWSPVPAWIMKFKQNGTKKIDGVEVPKWVDGELDLDALIQYYADYLNYMGSKGFKITYLDVTNEKAIVNPAQVKIMNEQIRSKLDPGVNMPKLIGPSSWNYKRGIAWINSINTGNGEVNAIDILSTHNTNEEGSRENFVKKAQELGKAPWNTEVHGWIGIETKDEIMNSESLWNHFRAGFVGMSTWLFYGPFAGKNHSMIWAHWQDGRIIKSTKYEIFKKVVNNVNGGKYVDIDMPNSAVTAAFIKGNILSVWILNKSQDDLKNVEFRLGGRKIKGSSIEYTVWNENLPKYGSSKELTNMTQKSFKQTIGAESLYFFKVEVE